MQRNAKGGDNIGTINDRVKAVRKARGMTLEAVSYTHLDVYKRHDCFLLSDVLLSGSFHAVHFFSFFGGEWTLK